MDLRQHKGLEVAALSKITRKGELYSVPSQSGKGQYKVRLGPDECTCPDFQANRTRCKHIYAIEYMLQRESGKAVPLPDGVVPLRAKNYTQNWPAYRLAQITEKAKLQELLYELCSGLDEPIQTMGRTRIPMSDMIFASAYKVYSQVSSRRFMTDLKEAHLRRYISKLPCYNTVNNFIVMEEITPYLEWLIIRSSLPLKAVETAFAVDSSGFSTCQYVRWIDEKDGKEQSEKDWVKAHLFSGVETHIVTVAKIGGAFSADHNYFAALFNETVKRFTVALLKICSKTHPAKKVGRLLKKSKTALGLPIRGSECCILCQCQGSATISCRFSLLRVLQSRHKSHTAANAERLARIAYHCPHC